MTEPGSHPTRERILKAAAELLAEGGSEAVSTRAVSARAGVQAPTLYRLFGDKQGMLDALISYGFDRYLADKKVGHARPGKAQPGPLDVLRVGWDLHVEFGVTQPALYALMYGGAAHPGQQPAAAKDAHQKLLDVMEQVAAAGVLRVPADTAAQMLQSAAIGVTLSLIANPDRPANADLSTKVRDAILAAITVGPDEGDTSSAADRLAALALALDVLVKDHPEVLSQGESALLHEWLQRLATA